MTNRIPRLVSIAGHPAILIPLAAALATAPSGDRSLVFLSVTIAVSFALLVFVYSQAKTRAGHWKHVDASIKSERTELNRAVGIALFATAATLALLKVNTGIVAATGLSGAIVVAGQFFGKIAKPSLHVGFAVFAACLTWPRQIPFAAILLFAVVIGWSRLRLERHAPLDLALGAALGFLAGLCFQAIVHYF